MKKNRVSIKLTTRITDRTVDQETIDFVQKKLEVMNKADFLRESIKAYKKLEEDGQSMFEEQDIQRIAQMMVKYLDIEEFEAKDAQEQQEITNEMENEIANTLNSGFF